MKSKKSAAIIGIFAALAIFGLLLAACDNGPTDDSAATIPSDMYAVGLEVPRSSGLSGRETATLWNNGKTMHLGDGTVFSRAHSVYVDGSDVYVVGYAHDMIWDEDRVAGEVQTHRFWKNGSRTTLSDCTEANSVYVSGSDVYVAGKAYENWQAALWKNGVKTILSDTSNNLFQHSGANSVFISGSDVYVVGYESFNNGLDNGSNYSDVFAVLWKNGSKINLSDGTYQSQANSVYVSGSDVYVAGIEEEASGTEAEYTYKRTAVLWKNGVKTTLSANGLYNDVKSSNYNEAKSVYVSGSDVYVAGGGHPFAILWKNGIETILGEGGSANSVYVSGSDVYVAGSATYENGSSATIWKNGVKIRLSDVHGSTAMAVARNDGKVNNPGVDKMAGAAVSAPQFVSKTHNSITVTAAVFTSSNTGGQTIEYGRSTTNTAPAIWQDGTVFIGLNANTTYYIFARAKENATHNAGTPSDALPVTTDPDKEAGALVSSPTLNTKSSNSITIYAVDAPDNGQAVEYAISTVNSSPSGSSTWQEGLTFSGLSSNTQYYIFARSKADTAHNAGTPSAPLSVTTDQPVPPPGTPSGLSAAANSGNSILVSWNEVPGATGYHIYRGTSANNTNTPETFVRISTTGAGTTWYRDSGLLGYMDYYYRVVAYNDAGESGYITTNGVTTKLFYSTLIVGTWFPSSATPGSSNHAQQLVFRSNGTVSSGYPTVVDLTYQLEGDFIHFGINGSSAFSANVNITNNVMTFSNFSLAAGHIGNSPYSRQ
ncbi:MAG: hypothetical protein LBI06_09565 [Treponema sp.]|jgi:hypothetical protein|nr:hypothetical protein [Treponema sp.]